MFQSISLREKLKKVISLLMAYTLVVTCILPLNNVYAGTSVTITGNNGSTPSGSGNGYDTSNNIGKIWGEGVRCYIYNKKDNTFIQTQDGYEAIDFLGANGGVQMASLVSPESINKETAFGEVSTLKLSPNYPFEIDGSIKYWVHIQFNAQSDLPEINQWLIENNASNLGLIVDKYWGHEQLTRLRRDENLLFCVEPLQIVPSIDDNGDQETENIYWTHTDYETEHRYKKTYSAIYDDDNTVSYYDTGASFTKEKSYYDTNSISTEPLDVSYTYRYIEKGTDEYTDMVNILIAHGYTEEAVEAETSMYGFKGWGVVEMLWDAPVAYTYTYTQRYKYIYGTTRWLFDHSGVAERQLEHGTLVLSELGVPTYYNVPEWSNNAVYCNGIGKNNEFNKEYPNICFSNNETMIDTDGKAHPAFEGELNVTRKSDDRITTYGLALYAPACNASIWHTNDYQKDYPSGTPTQDSPNYPNDAHQYGNVTVEKIYEVRNANTNELKSTWSVVTTGISDTIEIEDEYIGQNGTGSTEVNYVCDDGLEDRTWIKWMLQTKNDNAVTEYDNFLSDSYNSVDTDTEKWIRAYGSGFQTTDWCVGNRSAVEAFNMAYVDNKLSNNGNPLGYAYETGNLKKLNSGYGANHCVTLTSKGEETDSETGNFLCIRLVKYIKDDGDDDGKHENIAVNMDTVLTESYITNVTDGNAIISNDRNPSSIGFVSDALSGELADTSLMLGARIDRSNLTFCDLTLGEITHQVSVTRRTSQIDRQAIDSLGYNFVVGRLEQGSHNNTATTGSI